MLQRLSGRRRRHLAEPRLGEPPIGSQHPVCWRPRNVPYLDPRFTTREEPALRLAIFCRHIDLGLGHPTLVGRPWPLLLLDGDLLVIRSWRAGPALCRVQKHVTSGLAFAVSFLGGFPFTGRIFHCRLLCFFRRSEERRLSEDRKT